MKLEYRKDSLGNEILQDENGIHQVMMEWEQPYMETCIDILDPSGSVLEIGFGLGYSAKKLCLNENVKKYSVIECSPIVWKRFENFQQEIHELRPDLEIELIKGRWQDVIYEVDIYDSIFFDDYTYDSNYFENASRVNKFVYEILKNHSKIGTRISFYSATNKFCELDCLKITYTEYKINIPDNCKYARGDKMYIPVLEKIGELDIDNKDKLLNYIPINNFKKEFKTRLNFLVVDNFLTNCLEVEKYALTQDFIRTGEYCGKRTYSLANESIKLTIESYIKNFAGKITNFVTDRTEDNYNGSYEYTNSLDKQNLQYGNINNNNWCGILFFNKYNYKDTGIQFYLPKIILNKQLEVNNFHQEYKYDITKWNKTDYIENRYNRLLLFRSDQYYMYNNLFGKDDKDGNLTQLFFFSTEFD